MLTHRSSLPFLVLLGSLGACVEIDEDPAPDQGVISQEVLGPYDFGYDSMRTNGKPARGVRPLLLILSRHPDRPFDWSASQYDEIIFGPSIITPTMPDYYREISNNLFSWSRAGLVQVTLGTNPQDGDQRRAELKRLALTQFNVGPYDADCNGSVTTDELTVLAIETVGAAGGQTGGSNPGCVAVPAGMINACGQPVTGFCSGVAGAGYQADFMTFAHELMHTLGARDIYSNGCNSTGLSVMSCGGDNHGMQTFHPDPWHKIRLGWNEPRIVPMTDGAGPTMLAVPQSGPGSTAASLEAPILLYDPARGANEYYLLENRNPRRGGYDRHVATRGLVAWYVHTPGGAAIDTPIPGDTAQLMQATISFGAASSGALGQFGSIQALQRRHGPRGFTWVDGSHPPLRVAVTNDEPNQDWLGLRIFSGPPVGYTLFGDLTADGRADALAVNPGDLWATLSTGSGFTYPTQRLAAPFYGIRGTYLGDIDKDRRADGIAINETDVWITYGASSWPQWAGSGRFWGSRLTLVGDVNGDERADIVAINGGDIHVALARDDGSTFAPLTQWLALPCYGNRDTFLADVDRDRRADVVGVNNGDVWVARAKASGDGFSAPTQWLSSAFPGGAPRGFYMGDFDQSGGSDLIGVNDDSTYVATDVSWGGFWTPERELAVPFYGSRAMGVADLDDDRDADLVAMNDGDTWVSLSNRFDFIYPARWLNVAFFGWY